MRRLQVGVLMALAMSVWVPIGLAQDTGVAVGNGFSDLPPPCGDTPISIARMPWPTAVLLAHIHGQLLVQQFECEVQIVDGDPTASISAMMSNGQPAVVPEMWVARISALWNSALESQTARQAGASFTGGALEGWFVPDFVLETHPGLTGIDVLKDYWHVFRKGDSGKARFISCPPDWACSIINRNLLRALDLEDQFEIVEPANRFELDSMIGGAVSKRQPIIFYYWQPNAVLAQLDFTLLDMGKFDPEAMACLAQITCVAPSPSAFAPEPVIITLAEWVFGDAPQVASYFRRAQMPVAELSALLAWQSEQSKSAEETAARFITTRPEIWQRWLKDN
jgi:glycine betaine/proline transport system substrate-binding protein